MNCSALSRDACSRTREKPQHCHAPTLRWGTVEFIRVPLSQDPFLQQLRRTQEHLVRYLLRYYDLVRLPLGDCGLSYSLSDSQSTLS